MEKSKERLQLLEKIAEFERKGLFNNDVEDDPETKELLPNKVDYLNKKLSSKIATFFANKIGDHYFGKMLKNKQAIIKEVKGIENFKKVEGGAIITSNHFHPFEQYAVFTAIRPYLNGRMFYKVIREGNYTNFPGLIGFFFRHCNTLPLSRNTETMRNFLKAMKVLLERGEKILVYPEQAMWWNYKKPRPLKDGAFKFAVTNNVPVVPCFITMEDSDVLDPDGFYVQAYTINILPPLYPDKNKTKAENISYMRDENYRLWKETYEEFYKTKLVYETEEKK